MKKLALLFPGQGSQYVGMGKEMHDRFPSAKKIFDMASEVLNMDLRKLCFSGTIEELNKTENTQPALLTVSVAAFEVYMEKCGILPNYSAGHSLGEISALTCSGAIKFHDALNIVHKRGQFMQKEVRLGEGAMSAIIGLDSKAVHNICKDISSNDKIVVISNYNTPEQVVVSGHTDLVRELNMLLKANGGQVIPINVSAPFHSPLMKIAAERLEKELNNYTFSDAKWPIISNVTGTPYSKSTDIIKNLKEQMIKPVQWTTSMSFLHNKGIDIAIELGPKATLKNLMKKAAPSINTYSYEKASDIMMIDSIVTN